MVAAICSLSLVFSIPVYVDWMSFAAFCPQALQADGMWAQSGSRGGCSVDYTAQTAAPGGSLLCVFPTRLATEVKVVCFGS